MAKRTKTKSKRTEKLDCGRVTHKLGPKGMAACRKAASRANKRCDGNVTEQAAFYVASFCRGTAPAPDKADLYSHGLANVTSRWGKRFFKAFSMTYYDTTKPETKGTFDEPANDLDVLTQEMDRLGIIRRINGKCRWTNLVTPEARTIDDSKAISAECDAIEALFGAVTIKPKRKAKVTTKCGDCGLAVAKCICDDDDTDIEDDPDVDVDVDVDADDDVDPDDDD